MTSFIESFPSDGDMYIEVNETSGTIRWLIVEFLNLWTGEPIDNSKPADPIFYGWECLAINLDDSTSPQSVFVPRPSLRANGDRYIKRLKKQ